MCSLRFILEFKRQHILEHSNKKDRAMHSSRTQRFLLGQEFGKLQQTAKIPFTVEHPVVNGTVETIVENTHVLTSLYHVGSISR